MKSVYIKKLSAVNFRNLQSVELIPHEKLNVFLGQNGQGKTNLLDAISLGASLRPIRVPKQSADLILFGQEQSLVRAQVCGHDSFSVEVSIFAQGKKVKVAGKPVRDSNHVNSKTAVVTFVPEDLHIVSGSASYRRRLLDQVAAGLFASYVPIYRRYEKALLHRNRLLKAPRIDKAELHSFNNVLADSAAPLIKSRLAALQLLKPLFDVAIKEISGKTFDVDIAYLSEVKSESEIATLLLAQIKNKESEEYARRVTLCGPHLDDLDIRLNGHPARSVASRGQARAMVLALKIAQMESVARERQLAPILLLDDVVGELDPNNAQRLLDTIERVSAQTFITTTHIEALPSNWRGCHTYSVFAGSIQS
jgi:DNA replication and repair protein RecF